MILTEKEVNCLNVRFIKVATILVIYYFKTLDKDICKLVKYINKTLKRHKYFAIDLTTSFSETI